MYYPTRLDWLSAVLSVHLVFLKYKNHTRENGNLHHDQITPEYDDCIETNSCFENKHYIRINYTNKQERKPRMNLMVLEWSRTY